MGVVFRRCVRTAGVKFSTRARRTRTAQISRVTMGVTQFSMQWRPAGAQGAIHGTASLFARAFKGPRARKGRGDFHQRHSAAPPQQPAKSPASNPPTLGLVREGRSQAAPRNCTPGVAIRMFCAGARQTSRSSSDWHATRQLPAAAQTMLPERNDGESAIPVCV